MQTYIHHPRVATDASTQACLKAHLCACTCKRLQSLLLCRPAAKSPDLVQHLGVFAAQKPGEKVGWFVLTC